MNIAIAIRYTDDHGGRFYVAREWVKIAKELDITLIPIIDGNSSEKFVDACDGLLLPGSTIDIDPKHYHQDKEEKTLTNDNFDVLANDGPIIKAFIEKDKPILGVCGGIQSLNVYFGGSLFQDVPGHGLYKGGMHHITIKEGSFLSSIYNGQTSIDVNSLHHQACDKVASNFTVTAVSDEGIVEAIEAHNILAVQYHPEMMDDLTFFKKLLEYIGR